MKNVYMLFIGLLCLPIATVNAQYTDLHDFNSLDGADPYGTLALSGNVLYGVTAAGGTYWEADDGNIFSMNIDGSGYKDLFDFNFTNGRNPYCLLAISDSIMYGLSEMGETYDYGNIFTISTNGNNYTDVHDFNDTTGGNPRGSLTLVGNTLYGTAESGGAFGAGCLFSINVNGTGYTDLFDFNGTNGLYPKGTLTISGNEMYGMTESGGVNSLGNIFSIRTNGTGFTDLYDFNGTIGENPQGSLTLSGGVLYGMTYSGGAHNGGTIFSINADGTGFSDLFDLSREAGKSPGGDLTIFGNILYGMTSAGAAYGEGNVFSIYTNGTNFTDLLDFNDTNGAGPMGSLTLSGDLLYGMTPAGGANGSGLVFSLKICTLSLEIDSVVNITCNGSSTGSAKVIPNDPLEGNTPYIYLWSNGATTAAVNGLSAGYYSVIVTNNTGCSEVAGVTITQPSVLSVSDSTVSNVSCREGSNGSLLAIVSGGTLPYTYSWTGGGTTANYSGIGAGTYTITITDNCGSMATASSTITQPDLLTVSDSVIANVTCSGGNNGELAAFATGGTLPYTYSWSGGGNADTATGISAGAYTVTVTDNCGSMATTTATITEPTVMALNKHSYISPSCNGEFNGKASIEMLGGTRPYTYAWSPNVGSGANVSGLGAGDYTVTVTDNNGCQTTVGFVMNQPEVLNATVESQVCMGPNAGKASIKATGGTAPYTYDWEPGGGTSDAMSGLLSGTYTVTVSDSNNCSTTISISLDCTNGLSNANQSNYSNDGQLINATVFPNPTNGIYKITGLSEGMIAETYDYAGRKISNVTVNETDMNFDLSNQPDGIYLVRILTGNGGLVSQHKVVKAN
jgi:uncharacterized repeat protein (TIGR03803 family)